MRHLAVDPSVRACGLAFRHPLSRILITASFPADSVQLRERIKFAARHECTHAVIEQANGYGANIKAAFGCAEARGRVIEICERAGLVIVRLNVTTWQNAMLTKRQKKGDSKERSLAAARTLGYAGKDHNEADAVNILAYAELNELGDEEAA